MPAHRGVADIYRINVKSARGASLGINAGDGEKLRLRHPVRPPNSAPLEGSPTPRTRERASGGRDHLGGSSAPPIRVAILTDNRLVDEGLQRIIVSEPSFSLAANDNGRALSPVGSPADIVLADVRTEHGVGVSAELRSTGGRPWVILFGAEDDEEWMLKVLKVGVRGILGKGASVEELLQAIHTVHEGQIWARRKVLARIVEAFVTLFQTPPAEEPWPADRLSAREQEIVRHVAQGLSNEEIAERLTISEATVKAHLTSVFQKLGVRGRAQLAALYHRARLQ